MDQKPPREPAFTATVVKGGFYISNSKASALMGTSHAVVFHFLFRLPVPMGRVTALAFSEVDLRLDSQVLPTQSKAPGPHTDLRGHMLRGTQDCHLQRVTWRMLKYQIFGVKYGKMIHRKPDEPLK